jgi:hypothetical protein
LEQKVTKDTKNSMGGKGAKKSEEVKENKEVARFVCPRRDEDLAETPLSGIDSPRVCRR